MAADNAVDEMFTVGGHVRHPKLRGKSTFKLMKLSGLEVVQTMTLACYLCGSWPSYGIDRVKSDDHYTSLNSKPCCARCNFMKRDFSLDFTIMKARQITGHTESVLIPEEIEQGQLFIFQAERKPIFLDTPEGSGLPSAHFGCGSVAVDFTQCAPLLSSAHVLRLFALPLSD